jgi:hypothetical protein
MSEHDLARLLDLVKVHKQPVRELTSLAHGQALADLSYKQVAPFLSELAAQGLEAAVVAFEIAFFYVYPKKLLESDLRELVREIFLTPGILANVMRSRTHQIENVLEVARQLVADATEETLASKLVDEAVTVCEESNEPYSMIGSFKAFVTTILETHPDTAWKRIGQSVVKQDPLKRFRLQHLLGRGFDSGESRLVSVVPIELLKSWSHAHPDIGPRFLAGILPPLEQKSGVSDWSPAMLMILEDYGDQKEVLDEVAANMGTFSSVGSAAGYYESFLRPLEKLLSHRSKRLSKWATRQLNWHQKMIAEEKKREEEHEFGIFR